MKIVILILAVLPAAIAYDSCEACINGTCHYREQLYKAPANTTLLNVLAVQYSAKIIYLVFQNELSTYIGAYWDYAKDIQKFGSSRGLYKINSIAVDQNSYDIYIAYLDEFTKYNVMNYSKNVNYNSSYHIKQLQYQNKLYVSRPSEKRGLYTFENDTFFNVFSNYVVNEFVVDKNHDVYFNDQNNIVHQFNSTTKVTYTFVSDAYFRLSVDRYGDAYLNTDETLYRLDDLFQAVEVGHFNYRHFKPVFDWNNNILFVASNKLYVLKPSFDESQSWCKDIDGETKKDDSYYVIDF